MHIYYVSCILLLGAPSWCYLYSYLPTIFCMDYNILQHCFPGGESTAWFEEVASGDSPLSFTVWVAGIFQQHKAAANSSPPHQRPTWACRGNCTWDQYHLPQWPAYKSITSKVHQGMKYKHTIYNWMLLWCCGTYPGTCTHP